MADFYQTGNVTTLHRLKPTNLALLERDLEEFTQQTPIGLVLPALYSEFERTAIWRIIDQLSRARYLRRIVVALGRASRSQFEKACQLFEDFSTPVTVLWIDGERTQGLIHLLEENHLSPGPDGKGRSCWLSYGYLLAMGDCDVIAVHDCDIVNYDRELLARLVYPVVHPNLGFEFCKGYYARITDRMYGRVTRLYLTPLVRSLQSMVPDVPLLNFIDSFRYALAGEFAMKANLTRVNRIPGDWGLEVGMLAETFRNCSVSRVCQVDLTDNYEHKHQDLCTDNPQAGLRRMTCDVAKTLFRTLASEGVVLTKDHFRNLQCRYVRMAEDTIDRYYADACLNDLEFDRNMEEVAVSTFALSLRQAAAEFVDDPLGHPLIPNWNRVMSAIPEFFDLLKRTVECDGSFAEAQVA